MKTSAKIVALLATTAAAHERSHILAQTENLSLVETEQVDVGEFGDSWFWWGMDGDVHFYYY